jgi:hypothetical protein
MRMGGNSRDESRKENPCLRGKVLHSSPNPDLPLLSTCRASLTAVPFATRSARHRLATRSALFPPNPVHRPLLFKMGQPHQAFAIAKVIRHGGTKPRYRCVAAWYHKWCYGCLPLHAVNRFVRLLKRPDNGDLVRYEIAVMHGQYGRYGQSGAPQMPNLPCTYTAALLGQAWDFDIERESRGGEVYVSGISLDKNVLETNMGSGHGGAYFYALACRWVCAYELALGRQQLRNFYHRRDQFRQPRLLLCHTGSH